MNATQKMRLGFGVSGIRFVQLQFGRISLSDHFFKVRIGNFQKVTQISESLLIPSMISACVSSERENLFHKNKICYKRSTITTHRNVYNLSV